MWLVVDIQLAVDDGSIWARGGGDCWDAVWMGGWAKEGGTHVELVGGGLAFALGERHSTSSQRTWRWSERQKTFESTP